MKKETRARLSEVINQLLDTLEFISWDTESQPASSEEEEKEERKEEELEQGRGFINIITDVFDYHEEVGDNNWMFRALSRTTFGSPKYHAEVRTQVVAYMTARSDRFSAGLRKLPDSTPRLLSMGWTARTTGICWVICGEH